MSEKFWVFTCFDCLSLLRQLLLRVKLSREQEWKPPPPGAAKTERARSKSSLVKEVNERARFGSHHVKSKQ